MGDALAPAYSHRLWPMTPDWSGESATQAIWRHAPLPSPEARYDVVGTGAMMPCFGPAIRSHSTDGVAACPIVDHGQLRDSRHRSGVWHMAVSLLLFSKGRLRQSSAPLHWGIEGGGGGRLTVVNSRTKDTSECKRRAPCAAVTG